MYKKTLIIIIITIIIIVIIKNLKTRLFHANMIKSA